MPQPQDTETMLGPYRVLDLTDEKGLLCGKVLGDLGADVIKIEPPGGSPARNIGPFYQDIPDPEKSLFWFAFNTNKRGITLNIESQDGKEILQRLVKEADFLIESFKPGYMASLGLGYESLRQVNPRLIMCSISPFGQTGPYSQFKATDMVVWSMSGYHYVFGDRDRPPVRVYPPTGYYYTCTEASAACMEALWMREETGEGEYIDVAAQPAVIWSAMDISTHWIMNKFIVPREGSERLLTSGAMSNAVWKCQDGYFTWPLSLGVQGQTIMRDLQAWMEDEGAELPQWMQDGSWKEYLDARIITQEQLDRISNDLLAFLGAKTKRELLEGSVKWGINLAPINTIADYYEYPQNRDRGYLVELEHPELGASITYPGAFIRITETPIQIKRRPPLIGEHNEEIYCGELGFTRQQLTLLKSARVI